MNKKVLTAIIIVIVLVLLTVLAVTYAPNLSETIMRMHSIPQH